MKPVIQILADHLRVLGADGLCHLDEACGCGLSDLAPCGSWIGNCVPARQSIATETGEDHEIGDTVYSLMEPNGPH